jgi:hypothetical protein
MGSSLRGLFYLTTESDKLFLLPQTKPPEGARPTSSRPLCGLEAVITWATRCYHAILSVASFQSGKRLPLSKFDPRLTNMHPSVSEAGKTVVKLEDNTGWVPFLGELRILTPLSKVGGHVPHCLMRFHGRCQYVESDTGVQLPRAERDMDNP